MKHATPTPKLNKLPTVTPGRQLPTNNSEPLMKVCTIKLCHPILKFIIQMCWFEKHQLLISVDLYRASDRYPHLDLPGCTVPI